MQGICGAEGDNGVGGWVVWGSRLCRRGGLTTSDSVLQTILVLLTYHRNIPYNTHSEMSMYQEKLRVSFWPAYLINRFTEISFSYKWSAT